MSDSSDSWETASMEEIKYTKLELKQRKTIKDTRLLILHKILLIVNCLQKPREYLISMGIDYEKYQEINKMTIEDVQNNRKFNRNYGLFKGFYSSKGNFYSNKFSLEIFKFLSLNFSGIPTRLYFVIGNEISTFMECKLGNKIVNMDKEKFNGNVFSISFDGTLTDQSIVFSKTCTHHSFFSEVIQIINEKTFEWRKDYREGNKKDSSRREVNKNSRSHRTSNDEDVFKTSPDVSIDPSNKLFIDKSIGNPSIESSNKLSIESSIEPINPSIITSSNRSTHVSVNPSNFISSNRSINNIDSHKTVDKINSNNPLLNKEIPVLTDLFKLVDDQRLKIIPSNISKMKIHPLYITEECCSRYSAIYPKRPVFGYFKGSPVYGRKNLIKLKTEKSWYMNGRILKDPKPYRIEKNKKLYAEFQTKEISVEDLSCSLEMEAFHPNFTPKTCVHLDCDPTVAKSLGIPYAECIVGFRKFEKIKRGIFIRKQDCFKLNILIREHEYFNDIYAEVENYEKLIGSWRKFLIKLRRFIEIKKRI